MNGEKRMPGRPPGAKSKDKYTKVRFREILESALTPREVTDAEGNTVTVSQFEEDLRNLKSPRDRINALLSMADFVIPKMKATDVNMQMETQERNRMTEVLAGLNAEN